MTSLRPLPRRRACAARALAAALVAALAGCGERDIAAARVHVDTLPGGIPRTISDAPVDSGRLTLAPALDIQPPELDSAELLDPQDIALASDGSVLVADSKPAVVKVFSPDGRFLRMVGRAGSGPGEFRTAYIAVRGDTLVVQDPSNVRGTTFNWRTGAMLRARRTACCFYSAIGIDGDGRVVAHTMASPPDTSLRQTSGFVRFALNDSGADTVFASGRQDVKPGPAWLVRDGQGRIRMGVPVPLQPRTAIAVDAAGGFVIGWSGEYLLRTSSDGRDTTALFGRPFESPAVGAGARQQLVEARVREMVDASGGIDEKSLRAAFDPSLIPDVRPAYDVLWVDRTGRRWIRRSEADTVTVHLDVFAPDGRWLDVVAVPASGWPRTAYAPVAWGADAVAVVLEGGDGRPLVRVYHITVTR